MKDIKVVTPSEAQQQIIEDIIRAVIAGQPLTPLRRNLQPVIDSLKFQGAEVVLLGCTELSVLLPSGHRDQINPLEIISNALIGEKYGTK